MLSRIEDIIDSKVSSFVNMRSSKVNDSSLGQFIEVCTSDHVKRMTEEARREVKWVDGKVVKSKRYNDIKKSLPCFSLSGYFSSGIRKDIDIIKNGLMCIEVDGINPALVDDVKEYFYNLPYTIIISKSLSGLGVYAIISYDYHYRNTKEVMIALQGDLDSDLYEMFGVRLDSACNNVGRLRVCCYDEEMIAKDFFEVYDYKDYRDVTFLNIDRMLGDKVEEPVQKVPSKLKNADYEVIYDIKPFEHLHHKDRLRLYASCQAISDNIKYDTHNLWMFLMRNMAPGQHSLQYYIEEPLKCKWNKYKFIDKSICNRVGIFFRRKEYAPQVVIDNKREVGDFWNI